MGIGVAVKYQEVYAYRTRRPSGWGRHIAYVGRTCSPTLRHAQHTTGPDAKPWADLDPRRYVLIRFRRCPVWVIKACEWVAIKVTMPVYNVQHNRTNPRRISKAKAKAQRRTRDAMRRLGRSPFMARRAYGALRLAPVAVAVVAAVALWSR